MIIPNLKAIIANYDVFLIDLWGVLHDGVEPYSGAVQALESLREADKTVILISNAPRRAYKVNSVLNHLGFARHLWDEIITSGEVTYLALDGALGARETPVEPPFRLSIGDKYFYIGPPKDDDILDKLGLIRTDDPRSAKFAIVTGFDNFGDEFSAKEIETQSCLDAGLPLICANPDKIVVRQNGEMMLCAGVIGEWYTKNGGSTIYYGKPYKEIYQLARLHAVDYGHKSNARFIAIGDGLFTDIKGAVENTLDSILISGGIHSDELGLSGGEGDTQILQKHFAEIGFEPTYIMHRMVA